MCLAARSIVLTPLNSRQCRKWHHRRTGTERRSLPRQSLFGKQRLADHNYIALRSRWSRIAPGPSWMERGTGAPCLRSRCGVCGPDGESCVSYTPTFLKKKMTQRLCTSWLAVAKMETQTMMNPLFAWGPDVIHRMFKSWASCTRLHPQRTGIVPSILPSFWQWQRR